MTDIQTETPAEEKIDPQAVGRELFRRGGIRFLSGDPLRLKYLAAGSPRREVTLPLMGSPECTCGENTPRRPCAHVVAAMLLARQKLGRTGHALALACSAAMLCIWVYGYAIAIEVL